MQDDIKRYGIFIHIIIWGALWGIFEATAGYLLHMVSFGFGWAIWYPIASFFMSGVYRKTRKVSSIFYTGLLCAVIKLLNLFLPGRIDRVINPAISTVLEALAMVAVVYAIHRFFGGKRRRPLIKGAAILTMNTAWRLMYALYLLLLAPNWIQGVSVISAADKYIPFFITQNLITSAIIFAGCQLAAYINKPLDIIREYIPPNMPKPLTVLIRIGAAALLLNLNIILQYLLR